MTEEKDSGGALLQDETLLRRVLEREPSLVSRIVSHADFLEALFAQPEAFRGLMRAPLVQDDYQLEQLLASVGGDGGSLRTPLSRDEARLLDLLSDAEALGRLLREQPTLAAVVAENLVFVEQVKIRKPQFYKSLLEKAQERFGRDAGLAAEIRAQKESLHIFDNEGGKNETEADRIQREGEELLEAVRSGHADRVQRQLAKGVDPNYRDDKGVTALMFAAGNGYVAVARVLLEGGANPNHRDDKGVTALMCAAGNGYVAATRVLLEGGANPNLRNKFGETARYIADSRSIKKMLAAAEERQWHHGGPQQERGR